MIARLVHGGDAAADVRRGALSSGIPSALKASARSSNRFFSSPVKRAERSDWCAPRTLTENSRRFRIAVPVALPWLVQNSSMQG